MARSVRRCRQPDCGCSGASWIVDRRVNATPAYDTIVKLQAGSKAPVIWKKRSQCLSLLASPAAALGGEDDQHKPAFWWATDLEPWKRKSAKLRTPADRHLQKLEGVVLSTLALFDVAITSAATVNEGDWE
jgi:hypothetical protein